MNEWMDRYLFQMQPRDGWNDTNTMHYKVKQWHKQTNKSNQLTVKKVALNDIG